MPNGGGLRVYEHFSYGMNLSQELFPLPSPLRRSRRRSPVIPLSVLFWPSEIKRALFGRTLTVILDQDFPPERMEVLIADGQSRDSTRAAISRLPRNIPHLRSRFSTIQSGARLRASLRGKRSCAQAPTTSAAAWIRSGRTPLEKRWHWGDLFAVRGGRSALSLLDRRGTGGHSLPGRAWPGAILQMVGGFDEEQMVLTCFPLGACLQARYRKAPYFYWTEKTWVLSRFVFRTPSPSGWNAQRSDAQDVSHRR